MTILLNKLPDGGLWQLRAESACGRYDVLLIHDMAKESLTAEILREFQNRAEDSFKRIRK